MRIEEPGPTISEAEVARLEADIGAPLPAEYRAFLLAHNGGYPVPDVFRLKDGRAGSSIHYFFQVTGKERTLRLDYARQVFGSRTPPGFLPVARDPGGNLILLSLTGPESGSLWFWDHEQDRDDTQTQTRNMALIADSFGDMVAGLHELED